MWKGREDVFKRRKKLSMRGYGYSFFGGGGGERQRQSGRRGERVLGRKKGMGWDGRCVKIFLVGGVGVGGVKSRDRGRKEFEGNERHMGIRYLWCGGDRQRELKVQD